MPCKASSRPARASRPISASGRGTGRRVMNIHEYQAKAVLKEFGAPVSRGVPALSVEEAVRGAEALATPLVVVKSQIHAGGRGKGTFKELPAGAKGGVRLARSIDEVRGHAVEMLGNTLVT